MFVLVLFVGIGLALFSDRFRGHENEAMNYTIPSASVF